MRSPPSISDPLCTKMTPLKVSDHLCTTNYENPDGHVQVRKKLLAGSDGDCTATPLFTLTSRDFGLDVNLESKLLKNTKKEIDARVTEEI